MIYQGEALSARYLEDGIAELQFHAPGSVNKFDRATLLALEEALTALEQAAELRALLLCSAKEHFVVGADVNEFFSLFAASDVQLSAWLAQANEIFNRLEDLPVPTLSVVQGYALGGGCECILATDFRVAEPGARIGLPEVKLGLIPGFGGSVRLPRLIGADNAIEAITTGREYDAAAALKLGLIDAVVAPDRLEHAALTMLRQATAGELPWQPRRNRKQAPLALNKIEATMSFTTAGAMVAAKAGKHYPAPLTAVKTIEAAASSGREEALVEENRSFVRLAKRPPAPALIGLFLSDQYLKSLSRQATKSARPVSRMAVLGAGIMGGGIAYQSALKGVPVIMKDIDEGALLHGMEEASKLLNKQLERGRIDGLQMGQVLATIHPTLNYAAVKQAELVVEAVVEDPDIKGAVLGEVESQLSDTTLLATNTSTIPINRLARHLRRPERFCGMHFFNPVHRMPLVEVVRGEHTSEETIASVVAYATTLGKSPVVVNDCPGFFVNRVLFPYFLGFNRLLAEGADFAEVDRVMEQEFGWPMGPAYLLDVVGIDTSHHAGHVMAESYPQRMGNTCRNAIDLLFEAGRFGQKNGSGFYHYSQDRKGKPNKEADETTYALLGKQGSKPRQFAADEIIARMMIPMINEVVRCFEEEIVASPAEADMALIFGLGFPPFHGGVFRYLDTLGLSDYVALAERYAGLGPLYQVPPGLRAKAAAGECYYPVAGNRDTGQSGAGSEEPL